MAEITNVRQERIGRLLNELRYEIERGMMEREIGEEMTFQFVVPISSKIPDGVVWCRFNTRPVHRHDVLGYDMTLYEPRLKLVK
jgi:hypothetical protein